MTTSLHYVTLSITFTIFLVDRYPKDWEIPTSFNFSIYGWGHNHRGQLGGVDGNKVKVPRICEAFAEISPVQIAGGEQTLFAVTADGKVCYHLIHGVQISSTGLCYRLWSIWSTGSWWYREYLVPNCAVQFGIQGDQGDKSGSPFWRETLPSSDY